MRRHYPILDVFLTMLYFFLFIIWIWLLIMVFMDIFRSHDMGGVAKALWVIFIIILPFLGVFVYLIARGGKMHERAAQQAAQQQKAFDQYVAQAAGTPGADTADQLSKLADLKSQGVLTDAEFEAQKAKILASQGCRPALCAASSPRAAAGGARRAGRPTEPEPEPGRHRRPTGAPRPSATAGDARDASQRLATRIEQDVASPLPWRSIAKKTVMVVVAGITIYLVFPSLAEVFDSFPKLTSLDPIWFSIAVAFQVAHFTCTIALQRIALRHQGLVLGHHVAAVRQRHQPHRAGRRRVRGGDAVPHAGGGGERPGDRGRRADRLLAPRHRRAAGPADLRPAGHPGRHADRTGASSTRRCSASWPSCSSPASAPWCSTLDGPLRWAGRVVQAARNRWQRKAEPMTGLPDRLVFERNRIRDVLGRRWKAATAAEQRAAGLRLRRPCWRRSGPPGSSRTRRWSCWPTRWPGCSR